MARRLTVYTPFSVPLILLIPTYTTKLGVREKHYPDHENGVLIYGSMKTYGGTETEANGLYSVENTANIDTWYRPDIRSDCRVYIPANGMTYEVLGEPENLDMRNQYIRMKVREVKGGA